MSKVKLFYSVVGIVEILAILFVGWINNRLLEVCIIVTLFFIFRSMYEKQWHAETLLKCATYSVIVFFFISIAVPSKNISIMISVLVPFLMTFISYHVTNYFDTLQKLKKKLESMSLDEMKERFTDHTDYELKAVYSYINRENKLADNIAMKYGYSTRQLQRIIKKLKDDLK